MTPHHPLWTMTTWTLGAERRPRPEDEPGLQRQRLSDEPSQLGDMSGNLFPRAREALFSGERVKTELPATERRPCERRGIAVAGRPMHRARFQVPNVLGLLLGHEGYLEVGDLLQELGLLLDHPLG